MTTRKDQEIEPTAAEQTPMVTSATTNDSEAAQAAQELNGEELEERVAPASLGGFTFTKPTSTSSP